MPSLSNANQVYSTPRISSFPEQDLLKSNIKQIQQSQTSIKREFNDVKRKLKDYATLKRELTTLKNKHKDWERISNEKDQTIAELKAQLEDLKRRMTEYDKKSGLKAIKDDQQVQKETKTSKRKTARNSIQKSKFKRLRSNSNEKESQEENDESFGTLDIEPESNLKTRRTRTPKKSEEKIDKQTNVGNKSMPRNAKLNDNQRQQIENKRKRNNKTNTAGNKRQRRVRE